MDSNIVNFFLSPNPCVKDRIEEGKSLRKEIPLEMLGEYETSPVRTDPVSILEEQSKTRLPELVPIRYERMLKSSFAFLRGGAAIMAADLSANGIKTGIHVQLGGDIHVSNFGTFGSAEHNLVFGINDFDETLPGPWEWDLKRLVTSIVVFIKSLGGDKRLCKEAVLLTVSTYRKKMKEYSELGNMELYYSSIKKSAILKADTPDRRKYAKKMLRKALQHTNIQVLGKLTDLIDDKYMFHEDPPFIVRETKSETGRPIKEAMGIILESYLHSLQDDRKKLIKNYRISDVVRKVVGVGSVGTRCWILYLTGRKSDDPLFLQVKQAQQSVYEQFISKSLYTNHGQRVVAGQRLIQSAPDIFLGWSELDGIHYYFRQLRDMKGGVSIDPKTTKSEDIPQYCSLCAWALALAHAKSGDAALISGYAGNSDKLDRAMVRFALSYSDQNEKDYVEFSEAARSGKIQVAKAEKLK